MDKQITNRLSKALQFFQKMEDTTAVREQHRNILEIYKILLDAEERPSPKF